MIAHKRLSARDKNGTETIKVEVLINNNVAISGHNFSAKNTFENLK